jgi:glycosyltransferase involved in cell wall biosynthesis
VNIAICHTDFRLYWLPRLAALADFLKKNKSSLNIVEIAGKGSPYAFAVKSNHAILPCPCVCIFPEKRMENISPKVASSRLYAVLDTLNPDVVISGAIAYPSGATSIHWARQRKRPVVIMDDVRLADVPRSFIVNWAKRRLYANVDAIFIPAPSHVQDYRFWGIAEEQMFFGVNVVDNNFFAARSALARNDDAAVRAKYGLPKRFFLGIGRQIQKKNWLSLIQAFSRLKNAADWGLVLVGEGPEATRLKSAAAGINSNIVFLPFQNQENLSEIYGVADCFVLPSLGETWGLVVNEAMASRLPLMVSRACGCATTLVREAYNGWQFDPHNWLQLAMLMEKFISLSEEEKKQMGEISFKIIKDWGLDRFCEGIWQTVQFCIKQPMRGYASPAVDRILLNLWKGRYRPV